MTASPPPPPPPDPGRRATDIGPPPVPVDPPTPPVVPPVPTAPAAPPTAPVPAGLQVPSTDHTLHPAIRWYWRLPIVVLGLVLVVVAAVVTLAVGDGALWVLVLLLAVVVATAAVLVPNAQYDRWTWRLTAHACEAEHGILTHQVRVLPYFRIQHIDIEHGPVDRWLGLARLRIHTASVTTTLPGLSDTLAGQLRTRLLELAAAETAAADPEVRDAV